jgi:flagellar basal-body rod modification protein FlgD
MAISAPSPTTSSDVTVTSTPAAASSSDATVTSDRFLKLLVAQMQNQDPLNPMDNAEVTSQMAQINTVTGIDNLNTTVQGLSSQFIQLQAVQGASLVGRDVIVAGNKLSVDATAAVGQGGFELANAADAVKVDILSPSGAVVQTLNLGAEGAGVHSFDWPSGAATSDSGLTFRVSATSGGVATTATPLMRDRVDAVSTSGTTFNLELENSGTVPYSAVKAFN